MGNPKAGKVLFEQCSSACAALAGCEYCVKAHEESLLALGVSEDQVHEIFRLAAVLNGFEGGAGGGTVTLRPAGLI